AYWHRKTYKKVNEFKIEDNLNLFEKSHFKTFSKKNLIKPFDDNIVTSLKILNLENFISIDQLKKQYKKMVKLFHPDLTKSGSSEKIIKLNEAYSILKNHFNK
ncbi:MAG: J domain-containing protein, partial [Pseudomonadota bacterium]|nr:J domain-containing protein [Pseudomonadota bacterium]